MTFHKKNCEWRVTSWSSTCYDAQGSKQQLRQAYLPAAKTVSSGSSDMSWYIVVRNGMKHVFQEKKACQNSQWLVLADMQFIGR